MVPTEVQRITVLLPLYPVTLQLHVYVRRFG